MSSTAVSVIHVGLDDDFDGALTTHFSANPDSKNTFVVFYGADDPQTGESWCPDCVAADPLIRNAVRKAGATLIQCPVGDRSQYKGNSTHKYRVHSQVKLTAIPTLFHWTKEGPQSRLVEGEITEASLASLMGGQ